MVKAYSGDMMWRGRKLDIVLVYWLDELVGRKDINWEEASKRYIDCKLTWAPSGKGLDAQILIK